MAAVTAYGGEARGKVSTGFSGEALCYLGSGVAIFWFIVEYRIYKSPLGNRILFRLRLTTVTKKRITAGDSLV